MKFWIIMLVFILAPVIEHFVIFGRDFWWLIPLGTLATVFYITSGPFDPKEE